MMSLAHAMIVDDRRTASAMRTEVLTGLAATPKRLPSKYFYDARGSALFERICEQPEYYLTRIELAILHQQIDAIAEVLGPNVRLVEYGSGNSIKTRLLLQHMQSLSAYVPVEISPVALAESAEALRRTFPDLEILPVCADFMQKVALPRARRAARQTVMYFPGSTIGNFPASAALRLLRRMRLQAGAGGGVLLGVDLVKDRATLEAAYNDAAGVTAEFTLNLLTRLNRELGADFDMLAFRHRARWCAPARRIETHIVSTRAQTVHIGKLAFDFDADEAMLVELSCKYTIEAFARLAAAAALRASAVWTDPKRQFAVFWLRCE